MYEFWNIVEAYLADNECVSSLDEFQKSSLQQLLKA